MGELDKSSRLVLKANEIETAIKLLLNWIRSESNQIYIQSNWPKEAVKRTEIEIAEIKITTGNKIRITVESNKTVNH